jgi:hypothetical protein
MKTSLAIMLAVAALAVGTATLAISSPPSRAAVDPTSGAGRSFAHLSRYSQERIVGRKLRETRQPVSQSERLAGSPLVSHAEINDG